MKIIAVNGSPRKGWNTARLLEKTLEGAASRGMETKLAHLYDLDFKGCTSCFACKLVGGQSYGRCAMNDGITPLLEEIRSADALVLGSPVYFFDTSGEMRCFMERLWFQSLLYTNPPSSLLSRPVKTALIYTMGAPEQAIGATGLDKVLGMGENVMKMLFGNCETLFSTDTLQFKDYSLYETSYFDPDAKQRRHDETFPRDMERAYELGRRLADA